MFIFTPEHVRLIKQGIKTQTRRVGLPRAKIGAIHLIKTRRYSKENFGKIQILRVWREKLCCISVEDAMAEGGYHPLDYMNGMLKMHEKRDLQPCDELTCYEFRLVNE